MLLLKKSLTGTVTINAGDDIPTAIAANPAGTQFVLKRGRHPVITNFLLPKRGNRFTGETGAYLTGANILTGWTASGGTWYVTGQTQQNSTAGTCDTGYPRCIYAEDVFFDDIPLRHVDALVDVVDGTFFFDYDNDRIYVGTNPSGYLVETSVRNTCFNGYNTYPAGVIIENLGVEKFATPASTAAIDADGCEGWIIDTCNVRLNHGMGVRTGTRAQVLHTKSHHNGQLGIGGQGEDILVDDCEISHNNYNGFASGWEAGGSKFAFTVRLRVKNSRFHHNRGSGIWCDIDNYNMMIDGNLVEWNDWGIMIEISYLARIYRNFVNYNGVWTGDPYTTGSGILVSASPDVEIDENILLDNGMGITGLQQSRGSGARGPYEIENLYAHHNYTTQSNGIAAAGLIQDVGDTTYFTSRNNRWLNNVYPSLGPEIAPFMWQNGYRYLADWQGYGLQ